MGRSLHRFPASNRQQWYSPLVGDLQVILRIAVVMHLETAVLT